MVNQISEIKEIVNWRNENIIEEEDATYLAFDSIEDIIDSEETKINEIILENITEDEKLQIIRRAKSNGAKKTKELIENIRKDYECYTYTAFDDRYDDISTVNNLNGFDDSYACMIEVFSDLVEPDNYQADFGETDEYFDRVQEIRDDMRQMKMEIEHFHKKENVKVTLSKWNEGCLYGMAMYIWIPYQ